MFSISEIFYSLQGEGTTRGVPAVFIRFAGCNLTCGIQSTVCDASKASWTCDSYSVWKKTNESLTVEALWDRILTLVSEDDIYSHRVHIVWTGGEPLLKKNEADMLAFCEMFQKDERVFPFYEVETNGTNLVSETLLKFFSVINCSPKLSNSGIYKNIRINEEVLSVYVDLPVFFKFVITSEDQWKEIEEDFLPHIKLSQVILMPGMDCISEESQIVSQKIWKLAQDKRVKFSTREHIHVWNKLTGV